MRGVFSGKKTAGPQQKNLKKHSQADGGGGVVALQRTPRSRSMKKTRMNKQKPCGNGDGGNTSEALQPSWKKRAHC